MIKDLSENFSIKENLNKELLSNKNSKQFFFFLNPHSFFISRLDEKFFLALKKANNIFIDGIGIYFFFVLKNLFKKKIKKKILRVTGFDFFKYYIKNSYNKKIFFLGSTKKVLKNIEKNLNLENATCKIKTLSPIYKNEFSTKEIDEYCKKINKFNPDILFLGLGAPKQEKIAIEISKKTNVEKIASIGAVFDYYANNPTFIFYLMRFLWLEWLYRLFNTPRVWKRTVITFPGFLIMVLLEKIFNIKNYFYTLNISLDINKVLKKKTFIIAAFNLAYYSFLFSKKIKPNNDTYLWPDGIFIKLFTNKVDKIPGRRLILELDVPKNIKKIHVIGNTSQNIDAFLYKKFKDKKIKFSGLPFGSANIIIKKLPKVYSSELVLVTLPTPKQEIVARVLYEKNKDVKILCIGGGLGIAADDEKPCPRFIEKIYLESIWRLRYQTRRRLHRLIESIIISFISLPCLFFKRVKINSEK